MGWQEEREGHSGQSQSDLKLDWIERGTKESFTSPSLKYFQDSYKDLACWTAWWMCLRPNIKTLKKCKKEDVFMLLFLYSMLIIKGWTKKHKICSIFSMKSLLGHECINVKLQPHTMQLAKKLVAYEHMQLHCKCMDKYEHTNFVEFKYYYLHSSFIIKVDTLTLTLYRVDNISLQAGMRFSSSSNLSLCFLSWHHQWGSGGHETASIWAGNWQRIWPG